MTDPPQKRTWETLAGRICPQWTYVARTKRGEDKLATIKTGIEYRHGWHEVGMVGASIEALSIECKWKEFYWHHLSCDSTFHGTNPRSLRQHLQNTTRTKVMDIHVYKRWPRGCAYGLCSRFTDTRGKMVRHWVPCKDMWRSTSNSDAFHAFWKINPLRRKQFSVGKRDKNLKFIRSNGKSIGNWNNSSSILKNRKFTAILRKTISVFNEKTILSHKKVS